MIAARADGNALFAEEIASFVLERGIVWRSAGALGYDPASIVAALPGSVQSLLTARVERLAPADRALLQIAAVIGRRFDPDLAAFVVNASGNFEASFAAMEALDLVALCHRFIGFGVDCVVPEQVAALEALGAIGGPEASRSVSQMIVKAIVQGPNLAAAVIAASCLGVIFPPDFALPLLRHEDPSVRVAACSCVRAGGDVVATLIELLTDLDGEVATAAACALGRLGRVEARHRLKHCLTERPSPRVIKSVTGIADEEAIVFLARIGRKRPELVNSILSALDEIDHARAAAASAGLRSWLSRSDRP